MIRRETYLADLGVPVGREQFMVRPVLVVSAQPWLDANPPVVSVVPLTRTRREATTHAQIAPGQTSCAKCEDLCAISPERLGALFGSAGAPALARIGVIVGRLLAL